MRMVSPLSSTARLALLTLTFGVLALAWTGCSGPRRAAIDADLPEAFPNHSAQEIRQFVAAGSDTLTAFKANARMSVDTPQRGGTFSSEIRQERNDSLYLSVSPGLGIEAARMLVTADSFYVYDRINKQLTFGSVDDAQQYIPLVVTLDDAFENLLGIISPDNGTEWTVTADSSLYYLRDTSTNRLYMVDPSIWRVIRYEQRGDEGDLIEERLFSDFDRIDGVYLPRRVIIRRPPDDVSANLYYRDLNLNPKSLTFSLDVSSGTKRVQVP